MFYRSVIHQVVRVQKVKLALKVRLTLVVCCGLECVGEQMSYAHY